MRGDDKKPGGRIGFAVLAAGLLLVGLAAFGAGFLSPRWIIAQADAMTRHGDARLSADHLRHALLLLRAIGGVLAALGLAACWRRARVEAIVGGILHAFTISLRQLGADARAAVASLTRTEAVCLSLATLAGAALRIGYLFGPIRYDEARTYLLYASRPLIVFMCNYWEPNNQLLNTFFVHWSTLVFGHAAWAIRLPGLTAGVLMIPLTGLVVRRLYNGTVGIMAAALVAGWSILVEYSVNGRGYALLTLLFLVLLALAMYLKHRPNFAAWVLFAVTGALGFYTIPIMVYPLGMVTVWLILSALLGDTTEKAWPFIKALMLADGAALVLTGLLYSPALMTRGAEPITANPYVKPMKWDEYLHSRGQQTHWLGPPERLWSLWHRDLPTALALALSAAAGLALVCHGRLARDRVPLMVAALWCPPAVVIQHVIPPERVWLFLAPVYLGMAAAGLCMLARPIVAGVGAGFRTAAAVGAGALLFVAPAYFIVSSGSIWASRETGTLPDASAVAAYLEGQLQPRDLVAVWIPADEPLVYYALERPQLFTAINLVRRERPQGRRMFIVVRTFDQTWERVLAEYGYDPEGFEPPRLVKTFPSTAVYMTVPRQR